MSGAFRSFGLVVGLGGALLVGCGDSDTGGGAGGAAAAVDPGKPVSKAGQLAGSWYRNGDPTGDGPVGVEFGPDGKRVTFVEMGMGHRMGEMTLDYAMLEGGRLRLSVPGNAVATQVLVARVNGDVLTIEPETGGLALDVGAGTFTKLEGGKTIAVRHKERMTELVAEREAGQKRVVEMLSKPGLAVVPADGGGPGSFRMGMELQGGNGSWQGTGYHEVGGNVYARQVRVNVAPQQDGSVGAVVSLGPVVGPPGAKPLQQESMQFRTEQKGGNVELVGMGRALRVDEGVSKEMSGKYAAAVKKQRELIDGFHEKVGHFVMAEGMMGAPGQAINPKQAVTRVALMRVPEKDEYAMAEVRRGPLMANGFGRKFAVVLHEGKPLLHGGGNDVVEPASDGSAGLDVQMGGRVGKLEVKRKLTAEELKAWRAKSDEFVKGMASRPLTVAGTFYQSYTYENGYVRPARMVLSCADGKTVKGTYYCDGIGMELPVVGQVEPSVLGQVLKVQVPRPGAGVVPGGAFDEAGTFTMELLLEGDRPVLTGRVDPGDGNNKIEMTTAEGGEARRMREMLEKHLAAGGQFKWAKTGSTGGGDEVLMITLKDEGGGKVGGTVGFRRDRSGPVTGTISESDGFVVIDLDVAAAAGDARPVATGPMRLWVVPFGEGFHVSGHGTWDKQTRRRFVSYAPAVGG